jgi:hypothetical protein
MNHKKKPFLFQIVDLFLTSEEGSKEWINYKPLLVSSYAMVILFLCYLMYSTIFINLIRHLLKTSALLTMLSRWGFLVLNVAIMVNLIIETYYYYRFVITKKAHIYLSHILVYYSATIFICGLVYISIYMLDRTCVRYINPPFQVTELYNLDVTALAHYRMILDFVLYSAFKSLTGNYFAIESNSVIVSIINWIQSLYTLSLISLFISSYVVDKKK